MTCLRPEFIELSINAPVICSPKPSFDGAAAEGPCNPSHLCLRDKPMAQDQSRRRSYRWRWSARAYLAFFAVSLILPILVFMSMLLWQYGTAERERLERSALQEAREIAQAIDSQLADLRSSAEILSLDPLLRQGQLEEFHRLAQDIYHQLGIICVLRAPDGLQLVNPLVPYGTPLPTTTLPSDRVVLASSETQVTDFFVGPVSRLNAFAVTVPVFRDDGTLAYLLNQSFPVERLRPTLINRHLPERWLVSIVDRNGIIVARNLRHDDFVGKPVTRNLQENTTGQEGAWDGITADGQGCLAPTLARVQAGRLRPVCSGTISRRRCGALCGHWQLQD